MISDEKFPKKEHLVKTKDFRRAYREGTSFRRGSLVLYLVPNNTGINRVGFVVGSGNVKLANRRNRIKRLLREAYRKNKKALKSGFDMVLVAKKDPGKHVSYMEAEVLFLALVKQAGITP
jgi:ribonuclease P protein component